MRRYVLFLLLIGTAVVAAGCAYTFNPKGQSSIKTLAVEPFDNRTSEYGLTDRLTNIVVDAFIKDGSLRVVPTEKAEAILRGALLKYERQVAKFDITDQVEQYKVVLEFEVSLRTPGNDSTLWTQSMTQEGIYSASTETEEIGQQRAGERLVEAIINKTTKSW